MSEDAHESNQCKFDLISELDGVILIMKHAKAFAWNSEISNAECAVFTARGRLNTILQKMESVPEGQLPQ